MREIVCENLYEFKDNVQYGIRWILISLVLGSGREGAALQ